MGLSASQARLLSITARLSTNEYESQQISNAKMRLATQSEEASQDYIKALSSTQLQFLTYDAQGDATTTNLTANVLYQYSDMKNQYSIINSSGQVLLNNEDAENFKNSDSLDEFLECYGIKKIYKNEDLQKAYEKITSEDAKAVLEQWKGLISEVKQANWSIERIINISYTNDEMKEEYKRMDDLCDAEKAYMYAKDDAYFYFTHVDTNYKAAVLSGDTKAIDTWSEKYAGAKQDIADCTTFQTWCNAMAKLLADGKLYQDSSKTPTTYTKVKPEDNNSYNECKPVEVPTGAKLIDKVNEYYDNLAEFEAIARDAGYTTITETYTYSDPAKAQWYTNLWYRLNGESSEKSKQGQNEDNFAILDNKLAGSPDWLQDSLKQGIVTLEVATNEDVNDLLEGDMLTDFLTIKLRGINWNSKVYTSASDITQKDDEAKIAKATAEYERKTQEINIKDQKYQNRIKLLDTEHNTLQAQYDSIKSAISENVKRSYTSFSG